MPVLTRLIPSPVVVDIRAGALGDLAGILADQRISTSGRLAIVISEGSGSELRERLREYLPADAGWFPIRGGTLDDAVDVADRIRASAGSGGGHGLGSYDTIVGLGGGRVIDVTKYAAARLGLPMVAVATNLAHDGICSPVSTLDNDAGRGSYGVPGPIVTSTCVSFGNGSVAANASQRPSRSLAFALSTRLFTVSCAAISSAVSMRVA